VPGVLPIAHRYWVSLPTGSVCRDLKRAIEDVVFAHGLAFTCAALVDATGAFLPDSLPASTVLRDRDTVTAVSASGLGLGAGTGAGAGARGPKVPTPTQPPPHDPRGAGRASSHSTAAASTPSQPQPQVQPPPLSQQSTAAPHTVVPPDAALLVDATHAAVVLSPPRTRAGVGVGVGVEADRGARDDVVSSSLADARDVKSSLAALVARFDECRRLATIVATQPSQVASFLRGVEEASVVSMVHDSRWWWE